MHGGVPRTCKKALFALRMAAKLEKMACTSSGDIIVVECVIGDTNNYLAVNISLNGRCE